ncbi:Rhomboid family protein [Dehalogenimonas formicexedens]|uniref:Rhomboid family protein n=1 Tax=Dehalogenimonas formicexedens TaxID=1839801 RepID=A0A1P8F924_9CHLR|nr:rhomboid family intramembrane serine protease [Dehalogenimonas formicexedens]APV44943.1 Rhomboid family protein [Dehalogenimonas formicexedens]
MYRYNRPMWQEPLFILIAVNVVMWVLSLSIRGLADNLALYNPEFIRHPWTIITSMFVHSTSDFTHILFNMIALYFFGSYLIQIVGERMMLAIYFIGGIIGGLFFFLLGPTYGAAIGASGAIFALGGALAVLRPQTKVFVFPIPVPLPLWVAVIGGALILSFIPNVAWQAHLGGLLTGMVFGYLLSKGRIRF